MKSDIITIFPDIFHAYFNAGILKRAIQRELIEINVYNLRDYTEDKHRTVDDYPYGGGAGMVMKPEPFFAAIEAIFPEKTERRGIMLIPAGKIFNQKMAEELSAENRRLLFLCGRYEAIDERVRTALVDDEISIGDYILTGGELAALVIIDAVARLIPDVLGDELSAAEYLITLIIRGLRSSGIWQHLWFYYPETTGRSGYGDEKRPCDARWREDLIFLKKSVLAMKTIDY